MCCLFGFYNYSGKSIKDISDLTNSLAQQATIRGTDAAGIAYVNKSKITIYKEGKSAYLIDFKHSNDIISVLGHTRHSTQGSHKKNFNNHPFIGKCHNVDFALAHNGVIMNDKELRKKYKLPDTKIETDSYIAVQMLEKEKKRQEAVLEIRKKYGKNAMLKGMNFEQGATGKSRNKQIGGHKE